MAHWALKSTKLLHILPCHWLCQAMKITKSSFTTWRVVSQVMDVHTCKANAEYRVGKCQFSMSGHLDAVSTLDIEPSGTTLVSGGIYISWNACQRYLWFFLGHDSSIRLWDIAMNKNCIQEFSAHRRKGHEGVLSVQYHKSFPWMVSGGADGIVKIYHHGHH